MTIGWALLGPGRHAENNVAPQMKKAADSKMVAVMSRDVARGETFAKRHGFAKVHTSLRDVLADPEIQALYDCTPDGFHADNAVAAAEAGKHILIEKPLAITAKDCERAIAACKRAGVVLGVVYQQRHDAAHQEARRMIAAGEIGDVHLARVQINLRPSTATPTPPAGGNWRADPKMRSGGALMSLGDHAFDTLAYIVDQRIEELTAFSNATQSNPPNERVSSLLLKLSKGAIGHASSSGATPFARRPIEIHGSKGTIVIENSFAYLTGSAEDPRVALELVTANGRTVRHFPPTECFRLEVEQFNRAIEGKGAPMTSADEGRRAIAISEAFYKGIRTGRVMKAPD